MQLFDLNHLCFVVCVFRRPRLIDIGDTVHRPIRSIDEHFVQIISEHRRYNCIKAILAVIGSFSDSSDSRSVFLYTMYTIISAVIL